MGRSVGGRPAMANSTRFKEATPHNKRARKEINPWAYEGDGFRFKEAQGHVIKEQGRKLSMSRMEGDEFGVGGMKSEGRWKSWSTTKLKRFT